MSNNIVRPITMTNGFLVFKFHPQFRRLSFQTVSWGRDKTLKLNG